MAMAEGSALMNRLMSENADLKKQVRLMKENQMLKRLLSESCQERCGLGGRDLLFTKVPAYPEDCSPGSAGEAAGLGSRGQLAAGVPGAEARPPCVCRAWLADAGGLGSPSFPQV